MVTKDQKKLERVITFVKKGLDSLADELDSTIKGINDFKKSLTKAMKDLKGVELAPGAVQTVSTSSTQVVTSTSGNAKTAAASTLFNLLSGAPGQSPASAGLPAAPTATSAPPASGPPSATGASPPKRPASSGPPKAPVAAGPPKAPTSGGPPKRPNLPPAPKLPPASGSAPPPASNVVQSPSFAKRPGPPAAPTTGGPPRPPAAGPPGPGPVAPVAAAKPGGGLSSLRDEMLEELNRLKKIMRGE